jgi:nucleotide-binding universal stress UspA family protein
MFKHLLVPTDGSELSEGAVERAVSFARESGARITFFYAKPDFPVSFYGEGALVDPMTPEKFSEMAEKQAQEILARAVKEAIASGVECATVTAVSDTPYEAIIKAADERGCDLIFMASHGRRGLSGFLLGSETQKVLTHSDIPVLVYR